MDAPDDSLLMSGIQHFAFCRRQWALIHLEQQWARNAAMFCCGRRSMKFLPARPAAAPTPAISSWARFTMPAGCWSVPPATTPSGCRWSSSSRPAHSWGLVPYVQALLLARTLRGDLDVYPPFFWK